MGRITVEKELVGVRDAVASRAEPCEVPAAALGGWYVVRAVRVDGATVRDVRWERDYRCADGTWTRERAAAETFAVAPCDLVVELRAAGLADGLVRAVMLAPRRT